MLELKPVCENCGKALPNESSEAMICSFECTFCKDCVEHVLENVCPNCGGGFERRPARPITCKTKYCITNYPASDTPYIKPISRVEFEPLKEFFKNIPANQR